MSDFGGEKGPIGWNRKKCIITFIYCERQLWLTHCKQVQCQSLGDIKVPLFHLTVQSITMFEGLVNFVTEHQQRESSFYCLWLAAQMGRNLLSGPEMYHLLEPINVNRPHGTQSLAHTLKVSRHLILTVCAFNESMKYNLVESHT